MSVCAACGTPNPEGARFCNACGARLEPAPPPDESRRTVTVLFVDVAGSTALGERIDPETLRTLMGDFFDLARTVVERYGGTVEKFIGDAVMAVFGLPVLHEDDALRAVRAAAQLGDALAASPLAGRLAIRTGVNTGEVVAGSGEGGQRLVTGDAVNSAARLEQAAEPGEILLGATTHRLVRDAIVADGPRSVPAKGKAEPLQAWRLVSVDPAGQLATRHLDAPLIGRERELGRLLRSYDDAVAERRCGLFTLLGPAGVGKSRLVHELVARVGGAARVLRGRSLPYGEGITFWPIAEMLRAAAGITDADDRPTALDRLARLAAGAPAAEELVADVATAIGIDTGDVDRDDLFGSLRRLFEILAADRPLVLVFDDLHWAEPTLVDLVEHIVDWTRGVPMLVVVLARPELLDARPGWGGGKIDAQTVLLEGLGVDDVRALTVSLLGGQLDRDVLDRIGEVAEGNPLFVEQLVAMLIEEGRLVRDGDAWRPVATLATIEVPPTISALLAARLDRLPPPERRFAERASVVGRVFERTAVAELSPEPERPAVADALRALVRRELIRPDRDATAVDETFRFRHILIRDAAYEALPKRDRADLHARFADWLESTTGGRLAEYEEIVGHHLDQAVRYRLELGADDERTADLRARAFERFSEAGFRALGRFDFHAAIALLGRAADLARGTSLASVHVLIELGRSQIDLANFAEADAAITEARDLAEAREDPVGVARAEIMGLIGRTARDPGIAMAEVESTVEAHIGLLEATGSDAGLMDAWLARGLAALTRSRWATASDAFERAIDHAERAGASGWSDLLRSWLTNAYLWGPTPAEAGIRRGREIAAEMHSRRARTIADARLAALEAYAGRIEEARTRSAAARAALAEMGAITPYLGSNLARSEIERAAGNLPEVVRLLEEGRAVLLARGETGTRSTVEGILSQALAWLGRDGEALEMSAASEADAASDDMASQISLRAGRALAYAHLGRLDEAVALAADAIAHAERTDQLNEHAMAREAQAEVLRLAGRREEAAAALDAAIELFDRKGNVARGQRARAARASLEVP